VVKTILAIVVLLTVPLVSAESKPVLGVFVNDAAGAPIVKATVYFAEQPNIRIGAVTGKDGLAYLGQVKQGTYRLCAMAQDYAEHCADVAHVDARAKTIVLTRIAR
jgi:hypothetical protein